MKVITFVMVSVFFSKNDKLLDVFFRRWILLTGNEKYFVTRQEFKFVRGFNSAITSYGIDVALVFTFGGNELHQVSVLAEGSI